MDIDLGIYFNWKGAAADGEFSPKELKAMAQQAAIKYAECQDNEVSGVDDPPKQKCNRLHFDDAFHIDVPVYHLDLDDDERRLTNEDDEWEESDPKAIYLSFKNRFDDSKRDKVRRLVRYLKIWAQLKISDEHRLSSVALTILVANASAKSGFSDCTGDDERFSHVVGLVAEKLERSFSIPNPANQNENLNRLSNDSANRFLDKVRELESVCDRALQAATHIDASEIWEEAFEHFFPRPDEKELAKDSALYESGLPVPIEFEPDIIVEAKPQGGGNSINGRNAIYALLKDYDVTFTLVNANDLPMGSNLQWTVRNEGSDAESVHDLGHFAGTDTVAKEHTAYYGRHFMDLRVTLNGRTIGRKRIPISVTGSKFTRRQKRQFWKRYKR